MITLTGLQTLEMPEDRALAYLEVQHNNQTYNWQIYIPGSVTDLNAYLQSVESKVIEDIDAKEAAWQALDPKTREILDPFGGVQIVDIDKSEIVAPTIPDYYARRRAEYPSITDQLGAIFKGPDSAEYTEMIAKIQAVKNKYPKT